MRKRIEFVDELRDPVRRAGYPRAHESALTPSGDAWELFELDRMSAEMATWDNATPAGNTNCRCEIIPVRRSIWNRYLLYGALLGLAEVAIILYAIFGGH